MKRYLIPILVSLALALGLVVSCGQANRPTPATQTDTPVLGNSEVCALVYNYLENKIAPVSVVPYRMNLLNALGMARPYFKATYQGNGKWQIWALGYGVDINLDEYLENFTPDERQQVEVLSPEDKEEWTKSHEQWFLEQHFPSNLSWVKTGVHKVYYYRGGLWNLYEVSGAIEPANEQASELLLYIQWLTR